MTTTFAGRPNFPLFFRLQNGEDEQIVGVYRREGRWYQQEIRRYTVPYYEGHGENQLERLSHRLAWYPGEAAFTVVKDATQIAQLEAQYEQYQQFHTQGPPSSASAMSGTMAEYEAISFAEQQRQRKPGRTKITW